MTPRIDLPGLGAEKDRARTPWAWLRGFAWFLLAWPLFGLLALGEINNAGLDDWGSILIAMLGPAGIGLVLLSLEWALTRLFGATTLATGQAVPSTLRDLSNLGLTLAILMGINVALVSAFEDENLFVRPDLNAGPIAAYVLAGCFGGALVLRALHRLVHGRARHTDLGEGWDTAPGLTRLLGYLTLIPMLLVCTVMIDYTLRSKPGFGLTAWVTLPVILWLGLRSAMARAPRYWARDPWEAWIRRTSLALPWWMVALALTAGMSAFFVAAPFVIEEGEITFAGRIIAGVLLGPIGLVGLFLCVTWLPREALRLLRRYRAARVLTRDRSALVRWETRTEPAKGKAPPSTQVVLWLRGGREVTFAADDEGSPLVQWLREHA